MQSRKHNQLSGAPSDARMIFKFSFVHAEHTCVDYDYPDIMLNRLAKSSVVSDIGADRAALFSLNLRGRARGRKQFGRSPIYQRSMLNGEIYTSTDLA